MDFFSVKFDGTGVIGGICPYESLFTDSHYDITSVNLTAETSMKMTFCPTRYITIFLRRIQRLQMYKIPIDVIRINFWCNICFQNRRSPWLVTANEFGDPQCSLHLNIYFLHKQALKKHDYFFRKKIHLQNFIKMSIHYLI